jgi:hypothetical protein
VPVYPVGYSFYYPTGAIRETKLTPFPEFIRLRRERRTYMNLEELKQFIKQFRWGMASPRK